MNLFDISVLKYANDSKMELKNLKIRSFYLFHKCELLCLKDIKTKDSEQCFKKCEQGKIRLNEKNNLYNLIRFGFLL